MAARITGFAGEAVVDLEAGGEGPRDWPTDVAQIQSNSPSLTPIQPELFWRGISQRTTHLENLACKL